MSADIINQWLRAAQVRSPVDGYPLAPRRLTCADGFHMSVQASRGHYCSPRGNDGPWQKVEIGFPSDRVEEFMPYIDGDENTDPLQAVYGYVPVEIVDAVIAAHGGLDGECLAKIGGAA